MIDNEISGLTSYQTFVLRIWLEEHTDEWRVLLMDTNSGERWFFSNFQGLAAHFQQQTSSST